MELGRDRAIRAGHVRISSSELSKTSVDEVSHCSVSAHGGYTVVRVVGVSEHYESPLSRFDRALQKALVFVRPCW